MTQRRYDLDWLRIFAFLLLILYHIGMLYVARWGYHFKSAYTSTFLENIMLLVNPWRMALLWMVSGIATAYVFRSLGWTATLTSRTVRLLLPLAFGVWVIVPPQLFVEMSANGDFAGSYWTFYLHFFDLSSPVFEGYTAGIWPHVDVNHLWYLRELWTYTLLLMVLLPVVNWVREQAWMQYLWLPFGSATVLFGVPLFYSGLDLATFPAIGSDGRREALGLAFFVLGYLMTDRDAVWVALARWRRWALGLALLTYGLFVAGYHLVWVGAQGQISLPLGIGITVLDDFNRWFWLAALFGYGYACLNRPHPWLAYLTPGVYPFYIVHQTLILLLAFGLSRLQLGPMLEPLLVTVGTFAGCVLVYEIVRRIPLVRPLFGLRLQQRKPDAAVAMPSWACVAIATAAVAIILPVGIEILF